MVMATPTQPRRHRDARRICRLEAADARLGCIKKVTL
jgi:hypothetical protein